MSETTTTAPPATTAPPVPEREKLTKKAITADHPTWCPGCGDFAVLAAFYKVLEKRQLDHEKIVTLAGKNALKNFFYAEGEAVRFGDALNFRFAITRPQNGRELPEPVKPLIVHLDCDDAFEVSKNFLQSVRQRMNVAQMYGPDFFTVLARHFYRVVDRTVS